MSLTNLNTRNPTIKRIMKEMKEMQTLGSWQLTAAPLDDNIYEWHFTIRGPSDTAFDGGIYHGSILLPQDYPFKPPNIVLLTVRKRKKERKKIEPRSLTSKWKFRNLTARRAQPNGRFEVGKKICLTISAHHPESWQPSWSVRTALVALIGFFPTEGKGAIGALDYPDKERQKLARASLAWSCAQCHSHNATALPPRPDDAAAASASDIVKQSGLDVADIKISKIVNIDEPDPASLAPPSPPPAAAPAESLAPPLQQEPNVLPEPVAAPPQQQQQRTSGGAISATQLFVYLLVTCIVALVLRKLLMAQSAPHAPIV